MLEIGEIYKTSHNKKNGIFKNRKDQKKLYSFKVIYTGETDIFGPFPKLCIPDALKQTYYNKYIDKILSYETLEDAIHQKQHAIYWWLVLLEKEKLTNSYNALKGKYEKDINYDEDYIFKKFEDNEL